MNDWQSIVSAVCDKSQSCLEVNAVQVLPDCGGACVLPQHYDTVTDDQQRYRLIDEVEQWPMQVIVYVEKSRQASIEAARYAWSRMPVGAQLLVCGPNALGIKATIKQLEVQLRTASELLNNKRKARVHRFVRPDYRSDEVPYDIQWTQVAADTAGEQQLFTRAGVFSADALDDATALLQKHMQQGPAAHRILDMACGSGHLGIHGLRLWPEATALFLDADARAIHATAKNLSHVGLSDRAQQQWWSAGTAFSENEFDLVVMNPPAHQGKDADVTAAEHMFDQAYAALAAAGRMLIVANRQLPYEHYLRQLDAGCLCLEETGLFKILQLEKR